MKEKLRLKIPSGFIVLLISLSAVVSFAQEVKVNGKFMTDSTLIGEVIPYSLTARYPAGMTILFPDSSYNYQPFEFNRKEYFTTITNQGISYDSVVYFVSTFETDSTQSLRLPVFVVTQNDCTVVASDADNVLLKQLVKYYTDSFDATDLPLKVNASYEPVPQTFNYALVIIVLVILGAIAAVLWILFGEKIRRHFLIKRLQKRYDQFAADYSVTLEKFSTDFSPSTAEAVMTVWKRYLEELEKIPFTKLTTRETVNLVKEPALEQSLRLIDRTIYGHNTTTVEPFDHLRSFADRKFQKKLEELRNG